MGEDDPDILVLRDEDVVGLEMMGDGGVGVIKLEEFLPHLSDLLFWEATLWGYRF
jgi:hypothetical protein